MESNISKDNYKKLEERVKRIKSFYNHLQIFVIMMLVLALFSNTIIEFFETHVSNINSLKWIKANIWINSLLWLFGIAIHGIYAFKYKISFIDKWEKKKVEELMNQNK